jgi:hypothetical protein
LLAFSGQLIDEKSVNERGVNRFKGKEVIFSFEYQVNMKKSEVKSRFKNKKI